MTADLSRVGLAVGHATDVEGGTGLTVIRGVDRSWLGAVEVMGRATGSRELDVLAPHALAGRVDAILLTGGSAYGLDAAAGVMRWMEEQHRGFPIAGGVVPIVPAAVLFDLRPLVAVHRVFDGQVVQAELLLRLLELGLGGVAQRHPDEAPRAREVIADGFDRDVGELGALLVRDAINQHELSSGIVAGRCGVA